MKYIVEADEHVQMISLIAVREGTAIMITGNVETFQTADKAIDEAYHKGFEVGQHEATTLEYQQGLNDAWECARKLFSEMSDTEINLVFPQEWNNGGFNALIALHPQDAIDRIKAYEEQQKADGIKVGDEVCFVFAGGETIEPFIVFSIKDDNGKKYYEGIQTSDGRWVSGGLKYYKTGRHFPQVAELFKAIKGEQRDCHTCKHQVASSIECVDCRGFGKWEPKEGAE